jgi:hypothetical protein
MNMHVFRYSELSEDDVERLHVEYGYPCLHPRFFKVCSHYLC